MMRCILRQERNEYAKRVRKLYEGGVLNARRKDMKKMAVRKDGLSNTITSVTKDNMLYEEYDTDMCNKRKK